MPSSIYLRRLSSEDRQELVEQLLSIQSGNCFICAKPIDVIIHRNHIDIDHIEPISSGGKDSPENFAATHVSCNRSKQAGNLQVARLLALFDDIAEGVREENRSPNLGDILEEYEGGKFDLPVSLEGSKLKTSFPDINEPDLLIHPVFTDKLSGFISTFLELPIEYLHHDDHINPRAIGKNLKKLVEEFYKKRPQLHVSLGWIENVTGDRVKVKIFDGQHKAAAQLLLGARRLPVRVFINPDKDVLLTANTHAGTTLRQVAFDKSVQRRLGSSLLADRMRRYREDCGRDEADDSFSERDLVNHFKGESREMRKYVIDWVRNSITTARKNKLRDYIDYGGRGKEMPLSYSTIEKTFYHLFISGELLVTPFNHRSDEGLNPRELEIEQVVKLMNIIAEKIYIGSFDHKRGTGRIEFDIRKGKDVPAPHLRACRMAREEVIRNWLMYVKQLVQHYFITTGKPIVNSKLFQYQIPDACWGNIENYISALIKLPLWVNRDLSRSVFGGKQAYGYWQLIFLEGTTPDGVVVMPSGLNLIEMIKPSHDHDTD